MTTTSIRDRLFIDEAQDAQANGQDPAKIFRRSALWRDFYFEAWRQQLARLPNGNEGLFQGPALAKHAAGLADDAVREAFGLILGASCAKCGGVGCENCGYTGRQPTEDETSLPALAPCRACGGSGRKGEMGDDGLVTLSETEPCPVCHGTRVYTGNLVAGPTID